MPLKASPQGHMVKFLQHLDGAGLGFILLVGGAGAIAAFISGYFVLAYLLAGIGTVGGFIAWPRVRDKPGVLTYGILLNMAFLIGMGIVHLLTYKAGYLK